MRNGSGSLSGPVSPRVLIYQVINQHTLMLIARVGDDIIHRGAGGINGVILRAGWGRSIRYQRQRPPDALYFVRQGAMIFIALHRIAVEI